jgi:hypothetical protein
LAPASSGPPPARLDESISLFVKEICAVMPLTGLAASASWTAVARGFCGGTVGEPAKAPETAAVPATFWRGRGS